MKRQSSRNSFVVRDQKYCEQADLPSVQERANINPFQTIGKQQLLVSFV
jgi:hypothetical protein